MKGIWFAALLGLSIGMAAHSPFAYAQRSTPVTVVNTESAPAFVRNTDHPAHRPFNGSCEIVLKGGYQAWADCPLGIPDGTRLVIEHVSAHVEVQADAESDTVPMVRLEIRYTGPDANGTSSQILYLPVLNQGRRPQFGVFWDVFYASEAIRVYLADGELQFRAVLAYRWTRDADKFVLRYTGHLVNRQ